MVAFGDDGKYDGFGTRLTTTVNTNTPNISALPNVAVLAKRYSIPGPDGELTTETSITNSGKPAFDYIWIGGKPIAEIDANRTYFDFTDHLNAPIIQTDSAGAISYWADYEPYGKIYDLRPGLSDLHQPIRLPGQVAEQLETGANGATDLSYNNARWYRPEWSRYSSVDPLSIGDSNQFAYAFGEPTSVVDSTGLWGLGIVVGATANAGVGVAGVGGTISTGTGVFHDGDHVSEGSFISGGGFAGGPGWGASTPSCPNKANLAFGGFAGAGAGGFFTNANSVGDLAGPFKTISADAGLGPLDGGVQFSFGNGIWIITATPPGFSDGVGLSLSSQNTNTLTSPSTPLGNQSECDCQ